jgi:Tfp pilus assembly protein PilV
MRLAPFIENKNSAGDTIVEVLIAVAVASLVLVSAYATSNRSVHSIRDTQEQQEALTVASTQVELIRANRGLATDVKGCFDGAGAPADRASAGCSYWSDGVSACSVTTRPFCYAVDVTKAADGTYKVAVTWERAPSGTGNVSLFYRLLDSVAGGAPAPPPPPPPSPPPPGPPVPPVCPNVAITQLDFPPDPSRPWHLTDARPTYTISPGSLASIVAGCTYNIQLQAQDPSHPDIHPAGDFQIREQFAVAFSRVGVQLFRTGMTADLPDAITVGPVYDMGDFTFLSTPDALTFLHYRAYTGSRSTYDGQNWNGSSVEPYRVIMTAVP